MSRKAIPGQLALELPAEAEPEQATKPEMPPHARLLSLNQVDGLRISTPVWIEERKHPWNRDESEILRFFRLFPARFVWTGIPIGRVLRCYHFNYEYHGSTYEHKRTEAFYGKEWRCWDGKPTPEQMESEPWKEELDE